MFPMYPFFCGGEMFPGTNLHNLDLDWIIKVVMEFYKNYSTIQDTINDGKNELEDTYNHFIELLNTWYSDHSEDIEQELITAINQFTTQANAVGQTVINSIPQEYTALNRSVNAFVEISTRQKIVYNYGTKVITFPSGIFCIYNGIPHVITDPISIDVTSHLQSDSCNLWLLGDYSIIAEKFNVQPSNVSARYLGSIYDKNIWINGVPSDYIKLLSADGIENSIFPTNKGSFIGLESAIRTVIVNRKTKQITFPGGFKVYRGRTFAYQSQVVSYTDNTATKIWIKNDGTIYCTTWNDNDIWHNDDDCIGYFYYDTVVINGVPKDAISVIETDNSDSVYVFGDSIPAGTNTDKNFTMFLHDFDKSLHYYNYAQGGTGYIREYTGSAVAGNGTENNGTTTELTGNNNVYKVMQTIQESMQNIIIMAGTNDWSFGVPLNDFRSGVENAINYAITQTQKVMVVLPIKRENWATANNAIGKKLADYAEIIKEVCIEKGVAYYDGYNVFINPSIAGNKSTFAPDGLHPNKNGHLRLARAIYETVKQAFCK